MAIGRSYPYDNKIQDTDLFLGTKSSNLTTVNYTAQAVADYLNTQGKISIGGQMVFKFVTVNPLTGTISFPALGGNNTPFSAITNLIVSVADLSTQNVVNFISYIVGSEILLTEQNQVSTFGNYKITAYAITANPNFYDLTVEYIGGYGNIVENLYYDLSFFQDSAATPVTRTSELINDGEDGIHPFITLEDIPPVTGYVPYTGATQDVDLGLFDITASHLIKDGGVSTQFLKADGSIDNNIYLTSADLPSTLDLFATTYASDIPGYSVLVRNITDSRFNTVPVNVSTGVITTTAQLVGSLVSDPNTISGNPGIFNITTIGNISRTSGTGQAEFFFRVYKRSSAGVETFITESSVTLPVINGGYVEFSATALWNDGIFLDTDRIVIKYYANRLVSPTGSNPTYQFQFGGISPVRSTAAVPVAVLPNIYLSDLADVEDIPALDKEILYWNATASLWEHSSVIDLLSPTPLTAGSVLFSNGTTIAQDNANFFWDNTNNRLGIGTNVPTANLHIKSYGALSTDIALRVRNSADTADLVSINGIGVFKVGSTTSSFLTNQTIGFSATDGYIDVDSGRSLHFRQNLITNSKLSFNGNWSFGANINPTAKVHIAAPGALSTDIALRVRNSADTLDIIRANGAGEVFLGLGAGAVNTGSDNTFIGKSSGFNNLGGGQNTALGNLALYSNQTGVQNTSIGDYSFASLNTGSNNSAFGRFAGRWIANGSTPLTNSNNSVFIGNDARANANTETNQIVIGYQAIGLGSNTVVLGNDSITKTALKGNVLINTTTDNGGKLQIKAPGALSTDIALRVRNSADTGDLMTVNGLGNTFNLGSISLGLSGIGLSYDSGIGINIGSVGSGNGFKVNLMDNGGSGGGNIYGFFGRLGSILTDRNANGRAVLTGTSALLEMQSTAKGFLPPRMTNAQRIAIATPAVGLMVYCTDTVEGVYVNKSTGWTFIG